MGANNAPSLGDRVETRPHDQFRTGGAHYREQAAEFRQMAETGDNDKRQQDLLDLAEKYDALADTVLASAGGHFD
jgi:hypothetical protein